MNYPADVRNFSVRQRKAVSERTSGQRTEGTPGTGVSELQNRKEPWKATPAEWMRLPGSETHQPAGPTFCSHYYTLGSHSVSGGVQTQSKIFF